MNGLNVRWRLTLWYGAVLTLIVVGYGLSVALMVHQHLLNRTDFELDEEMTELALEVRLAKDEDDLKKQLQHRFYRHASFNFQVSPVDGPPLFRSEGLGEFILPTPQESAFENQSGSISESLSTPHLGQVRVATRKAKGAQGEYLIQAEQTLAPNYEEMTAIIGMLVSAGVIAISAALCGGYFLARHALAPVNRMATTAELITGSRLDERIKVVNPGDELGHLARTFNSMLDRLQRDMEEMRRFTSDAAHELRTPLAVLQTETEVALRTDRTNDEYRKVLEVTLDHTRRLGRLADRLLTLSRHDSGLAPKYCEEVPLDALLQDVIDQIRIAAEEKEITVDFIPLEECTVHGDDVQLCQVLFNVMENAVKFTPVGGHLAVHGKLIGGYCLLTVSDDGIGIPAADLPCILDRFYRVDQSRNGRTGGAGLGLAISKAIVESHGGTISISSTVNVGTQVEIRLPLMSPTKVC